MGVREYLIFWELTFEILILSLSSVKNVIGEAVGGDIIERLSDEYLPDSVVGRERRSSVLHLGVTCTTVSVLPENETCSCVPSCVGQGFFI